MRLDYFSFPGYVSVLLWLIVPVLWALHFRARPKRWLCHIALGIALAAYILARVNSITYVNRIQLDQSAQIAAEQAKFDAAKKAAEDARGDDVAKIKFAEDTSGDYLDKAGMDESDLKYMEKLEEDAAPEWKKAKKERSTEKKEDNSIEALIGAKKETEGIEAEVAAVSEESSPVLMVEKDKMLANRLDAMNLSLIRLVLLTGLVVVVVDYLRRINVYREAYLPLPLPGSWLNSFVPVPPVFRRPSPARRSVPEELSWLTQRGEVFVYMTDNRESAEAVPSLLPRIGRRFLPVEVIRAGKDDALVTEEFVFETLWYGRGSFVVDTFERSEQLLGWFVEFMQRRKEKRAKTRQTVYVIWDMDVPLEDTWQADFAKLAEATGVSLFLCR